MTQEYDDSNWREDYLNTKARLSKYQVDLLKNGPNSLASSWMLGAMHGEWKKMKGYEDPEPPDCQSSLEEFFRHQKDQGI